ncbi:unnamed protein product [Rhizoctonia solani]|uniref:Transmembrane protein n=1 Tax=Rhizoctonia solani TaxID=456999 RepID=A0A8H3HZL9_9AGAM|nr:unnamed protein product [Rhizoctonia solani]
MATFTFPPAVDDIEVLADIIAQARSESRVVLFVSFTYPNFDHSCKSVVLAYSFISILTSFNIAVVIILRCWALYDRKPWILRFLGALLMLAIIPCGFILKRQADANIYPVNTMPELVPGCIIIYTEDAWIPYVFALIFESIVFSMMVYKTYSVTREYGGTPLIRRLLIDGTQYYAGAIIAVIFCLCAATVNLLRAPVISSGLLASILSAMCSRMILSLYDFTQQEQPGRVRTSEIVPAPSFSAGPCSIEHDLGGVKVIGANDSYRAIEMDVLRFPYRTNSNV